MATNFILDRLSSTRPNRLVSLQDDGTQDRPIERPSFPNFDMNRQCNCFTELHICGLPNPVQPNPVQPNPVQPNPVQSSEQDDQSSDQDDDQHSRQDSRSLRIARKNRKNIAKILKYMAKINVCLAELL